MATILVPSNLSEKDQILLSKLLSPCSDRKAILMTLVECLFGIEGELDYREIEDETFSGFLNEIERHAREKTGMPIRNILKAAYIHLYNNEDYKREFKIIKAIGYMIYALDLKHTN